MKTLSQTWFAEGYIDFELKKYTLLAYLKEIQQCFGENKLYPQLGDLIFHFNNIRAFRQNRDHLKQHFPKRFTQIDLHRLEMLYEALVEDSDLMQELEDILQFATEQMNSTIQAGTGIYEFVEEKLNIFPIGIVPLASKEGYFLLADHKGRETKAFEYHLSFFEKHDEKYQSIRTTFIASWERNLVNTYESIKSELIRNRKVIPNPAVYGIESELSYPVEETLLPIAKRRLVRYIAEEK